jgi:hypothetical protein
MSEAAQTPAPAPARDPRPLQLEGLGIAGFYALSFLWVHLTSGLPLLGIPVVVCFLVGLVAVPVVVGLPVVLLRRALVPGEAPGPLAAIAPLAPFACYGLQMVLVYLATSHAYRFAMGV